MWGAADRRCRWWWNYIFESKSVDIPLPYFWRQFQMTLCTISVTHVTWQQNKNKIRMRKFVLQWNWQIIIFCFLYDRPDPRWTWPKDLKILQPYAYIFHRETHFSAATADNLSYPGWIGFENRLYTSLIKDLLSTEKYHCVAGLKSYLFGFNSFTTYK